MSPDARRGFKLLDLMVVIVAIGIMLAMISLALNWGRRSWERTQCANNLRQLGLALLNASNSKNHFPNAGTFRDDPATHGGDPARSNIYRSIVDPRNRPDVANSWLYSWVIDIANYLDVAGLRSAWDETVPYWWPAPTIANEPANCVVSRIYMGVLRCPADPTAAFAQGNLSYVVNGGFTRWHAIPVGWMGSPIDGQAQNGGVRQWTPPGRPWQETQAIGKQLGVMFLGTQTGDQPWDITTTPADLSDGASATLLIAENTLAGYSKGSPVSSGKETNWACPLPNFVMFLGSDNVCMSTLSPNDCLGGQLAPRSGRPDGPGWARANQTGTYENINYGQKLTVEGSFPFANSGHSGGSNFAFCDGAVRFLSDSIDGTVYSKLITPAGQKLPGALTQGPFSGDLD